MLGKTRGNRGEVTAVALSSKPERYQALKEVFLFAPTVLPGAKDTKSNPRGFTSAPWFSSSAGVDSISDAERLYGREVRIPVSQRVTLDEGEYFQSDLIGCEVVDRRPAQSLGRVTGWEDGGGSGLLDRGRRPAGSVRAIHLRGDRSGRQTDRRGIARRTEGPEPPVIFHVLTIFPEFFEGPFAPRRGQARQDAGLLDIRIHDLRDWTHDRHRTVDDRPFGGGEGMVLKSEPIFDAVESIWPERNAGQKVMLLSAQGRLFDQAMANRLKESAELLLICGRYEGVDERVAEHLADEEISIGDYVLSGGELAAAVVIDTVARLLAGSAGQRSFGGLRIVPGYGPRRRPARLPALDPPRRVPRLESAGSAARRQSRGDPQIPQEDRPGENREAAAGSAPVGRLRPLLHVVMREHIGRHVPGARLLFHSNCLLVTHAAAQRDQIVAPLLLR